MASGLALAGRHKFRQISRQSNYCANDFVLQRQLAVMASRGVGFHASGLGGRMQLLSADKRTIWRSRAGDRRLTKKLSRLYCCCCTIDVALNRSVKIAFPLVLRAFSNGLVHADIYVRFVLRLLQLLWVHRADGCVVQVRDLEFSTRTTAAAHTLHWSDPALAATTCNYKSSGSISLPSTERIQFHAGGYDEVWWLRRRRGRRTTLFSTASGARTSLAIFSSFRRFRSFRRYTLHRLWAPTVCPPTCLLGGTCGATM